MNNNQLIEEYIVSVTKKFPLYSEDESQYVDFIRRSMYEYSDENPDFTHEDLEYYFGTPEDIVHAYLLKLETDKLVKKISVQYRNRLIVFIILVVTIILSALLISYTFGKYDETPKTPDTIIEQWAPQEVESNE